MPVLGKDHAQRAKSRHLSRWRAGHSPLAISSRTAARIGHQRLERLERGRPDAVIMASGHDMRGRIGRASSSLRSFAFSNAPWLSTLKPALAQQRADQRGVVHLHHGVDGGPSVKARSSRMRREVCERLGRMSGRPSRSAVAMCARAPAGCRACRPGRLPPPAADDNSFLRQRPVQAGDVGAAAHQRLVDGAAETRDDLQRLFGNGSS